jgi:glycosyltransferase 2 family protein
MADPQPKNRNRVWYGLLSFLLAAGLLYYALRGVEWGRVWETIAHAQWQYLAATALLTGCSFFCRSYRWRILLNSQAQFDIPTVFWATMAGYLGNAFLPARAGELVRTFVISSRSSLSAAFVLTTALCERMMDAIALVLASSVILLGVNPKPAWLGDVSKTMAILAGAGLLAIVVLPHTGDLCQRILNRLPLPRGLRNRLLELSVQILLGLRALHSFRRLGGFIFWTVVIWSLDCFGTIVCARGLGLHFSIGVALLLLAGLGLGSALPSTPGYVGIYQFVAVSVLTPFGIGHDAAVAYILVTQALGYVVVSALGLPAIYRFKGWRQAAGGG